MRIYCSAIQPSDKLNAKGTFRTTTYPRVPGRDFSGVVVDGPEDRIGEAVYGSGGGILGFAVDGAHAEYCLLPASSLVPKPKPLSFIQAATVGVPYTAALLSLKRARAQTNDTVLVLGAKGSVGSAAVQIAKAMGCKRVLSAARGDDADVNLSSDPKLDTVWNLTEGKGIDIVVDTVGNLDLMKAAIHRLASRGRYTWIAAPRGGASTELNFDILQAYRKEIELIGCNTGNYSIEEVSADLNMLHGWFEKGVITARDDQSFKTVPLDEAIEKGYNASGKRQVVITMVPGSTL